MQLLDRVFVKQIKNVEHITKEEIKDADYRIEIYKNNDRYKAYIYDKDNEIEYSSDYLEKPTYKEILKDNKNFLKDLYKIILNQQ